MISTLAFATLISSTFAFLLALLAAYLLNVSVDPVCMSEALPFLVITVGFDKPFLLAKAVFTNPEIAPIASEEEQPVKTSPPPLDRSISADPPQTTGLGLDLGALHKGLEPFERLQRLAAERKRSVRWAAPVSAKTIVVDAVQKVGVGIVRDYAIEIAALSIGAASGIGGLREFCYLGERFVSQMAVSLMFGSCVDHGIRLHLLVFVLRGYPKRHGRGQYTIASIEPES